MRSYNRVGEETYRGRRKKWRRRDNPSKCKEMNDT
jgi:hypothetical protein